MSKPVEQHGLSFVVQHQGRNRQGVEYFLECGHALQEPCQTADFRSVIASQPSEVGIGELCRLLEQEQQAGAEKLASVGRLAASVAHEIRNPLTAMKMWLFSLREAVGGQPELNRKLMIVDEELTRLEMQSDGQNPGS